ncbi:MAG: hypothetical protein CMD85_00050 [Gammaproteobacteria bacterium]|nr:hypothetical protein [Gammaproteobacteria bacterium]|tara:strand:+ start:74 stop:511 length:438 start_codon:yes stop_codon:yes gene_type:complete
MLGRSDGIEFCSLIKKARKTNKFIRIKHCFSGYVGVVDLKDFDIYRDFPDNFKRDKNGWIRVRRFDIKRLSPLPERERIGAIDVSVDLHNPCCLDHALSELEEEFLRISKQIYKQECEICSYFYEGLEIDSEDSEKIEVYISTGT